MKREKIHYYMRFFKKNTQKPTGIWEVWDHKISQKNPEFMPSNHRPMSLTFLPQK